ncbi:hypothetical protein C0995_005126, partial [Termitomyces sp. Mi166
PRESTIYDDEDLPPTGGALEPQPEPQVEPVMEDPPPLRRSGRIPIPTARADPENAAPSRVQRAVQESIEAGERVHAAQAECRRIDQDDTTNNLNPATSNQGTEGLDQNLIAPNLADIALIEDLKHLLAAVEELNNDPAAPEISDEP